MQEHYAKIDWTKHRELQEQEARMFPTYRPTGYQ